MLDKFEVKMKINEKIIAHYEEQNVIEYILSDENGFSIGILNYGGIIWEIHTPDKHGNIASVVVQHPQFELENPGYMGAITGRIAGRIALGKFKLSGKEYELEQNRKGHNLHGGSGALDKKFWNVDKLTNGIELSYISPEGENGFPAQVEFKVTYLITAPFQLTITASGKPNCETIINLTNHSYFDLSTKKSLTQKLKVASSYFAAIDDTQLATGELISIERTPFDFKQEQLISAVLGQKHAQLICGNGIDHPFILDKEQQWPIQLRDPESGRYLKIKTTEPTCVIYTANHFSKPGSAVCLETQRLPNAINFPEYQDQVIHSPEKPYLSQTVWQFGASNNDQ